MEVLAAYILCPSEGRDQSSNQVDGNHESGGMWRGVEVYMVRNLAQGVYVRVLNLQVHSFHAMGRNYWSDACVTDAGLKQIVELGSQPTKPLPRYNVIMIDECQDVTPLLFAFLHLVYAHATKAKDPKDPAIQLLCVGDVMQSIFQYRESDERFLRLAHCIMPSHGETLRTARKIDAE